MALDYDKLTEHQRRSLVDVALDIGRAADVGTAVNRARLLVNLADSYDDDAGPDLDKLRADYIYACVGDDFDATVAARNALRAALNAARLRDGVD